MWMKERKFTLGGLLPYAWYGTWHFTLLSHLVPALRTMPGPQEMFHTYFLNE